MIELFSDFVVLNPIDNINEVILSTLEMSFCMGGYHSIHFGIL